MRVSQEKVLFFTFSTLFYKTFVKNLVKKVFKICENIFLKYKQKTDFKKIFLKIIKFSLKIAENMDSRVWMRVLSLCEFAKLTAKLQVCEFESRLDPIPIRALLLFSSSNFLSTY